MLHDKSNNFFLLCANQIITEYQNHFICFTEIENNFFLFQKKPSQRTGLGLTPYLQNAKLPTNAQYSDGKCIFCIISHLHAQTESHCQLD